MTAKRNRAKGSIDLKRRNLLRAGAAASAGVVGWKLGPQIASAQPKGKEQLVIVSWGGNYQDAQRKTIFKPFETESGVTVVEASPPDVSKLKVMVDSGNVEWDVVCTSLNYFLQLGAKYFEQIDYSGYPKQQLDALIPQARLQYAVGAGFFADIMAYRKDAFPSGQHPKTWADFWDGKRFPGPRTLTASNGVPAHTLEHALMADGVPLDKIYPIDVDRAFASLDRVKPYVVKWWETGSQPGQLLTDREVVLASWTNARVQDFIDQGLPIGIEWQGGTMNQDLWFIVKGARNSRAAQRFIQYASRPEVQARFSNAFAFGPASTKAFEFISDARAAVLPTNPKYLKEMLFFDVDWWGKNRPIVAERFAQWRLK